MRAVDTNVLVRLIARDDAAQTAAAEAFVSKGVWISLLVLVETLWVLVAVYTLTANQVAAAVEMLLSHKDLSVQDSDVVAAALELFRKRPRLGFSDCLVLQVARSVGHVPLGTFDQELAKCPGAERLAIRLPR